MVKCSLFYLYVSPSDEPAFMVLAAPGMENSRGSLGPSTLVLRLNIQTMNFGILKSKNISRADYCVVHFHGPGTVGRDVLHHGTL